MLKINSGKKTTETEAKNKNKMQHDKACSNGLDLREEQIKFFVRMLSKTTKLFN